MAIRETTIHQLQCLPREIYEQAQAVETKRCQMELAKDKLVEQENKIMPTLDGKNAEIRRAQLMELTGMNRALRDTAEQDYRQEILKLELKRDMFRATQSIAALLIPE